MLQNICIYFSVTITERRELSSAIFAAAFLLLLLPDTVFAYTPFSAYDDSLFGKACKGILTYQSGSNADGLGSLLTAVAGMGAIVSAAVGGFRIAWALIVVSLGTYIFSDFIHSPFGFPDKC